MSRGFLLGIVTVTFIFGMAAGYWLTPEYQRQNVAMKGAHELGAADQWVDLRYIDGMIAHHLSAIFILEQVQQQSQRPEMKQLAQAVIAADTAGIEQLYAIKKEWYSDTRKITSFKKVNLGSADDTFDLRAVNALIAHHEEAIDKADEVSTKSVRSETLDVANEVQSSLTASKQQLEQWRKEWYGIE